MRELVELSITSFIGSIGGEHYYGAFSVWKKGELIDNGRGGQSTLFTHDGDKHPLDGHRIERKIGPREVAYLNKKDGSGFITRSAGYKSGDLTDRFNDIPSIVKKAEVEFPKLFDANDLLVIEAQRHNGIWRALAGPAELVEAVNANQDYVAQHRLLTVEGYLVSNPESFVE